MKCYEEKVENNLLIPAAIYIGEAGNKNYYYPMHWHNNLEFDFVLNGSICAKIHGEEIEIKEGDFLFVNSGELHETKAKSIDNLKTVTILLSYNLLKQYSDDVDSYYFDFSNNKKAKEKVSHLIIKCLEIYERKNSYYELKLSIILREICLILFEECKKKRKENKFNLYYEEGMSTLKKAIVYMEKNYDSDLSLKDIASEVNMTPTYFSRFFKKYTGETFYEYLRKTRMYYAYNELINTNSSITEIALNNGFANVKSFIELFKKMYNTTPAKYKSKFIKNKKDNNI